MNFLIAVPLIFTISNFIIFYTHPSNHFYTHQQLRLSILWSLILTSINVFISTEVLSLLNSVNAKSVILWWCGTTITSLIIVVKSGFWQRNYKKIILEKESLIGLLTILFFVVVLLLIAILQPPNNWDGMTYHMSRVMHWIQNGNVDYYATHIDRQILLNPFAEYHILHTILLTSNDYFANVVQWVAMIGILMVTSLIARKLGAVNLKTQILVSLFTLSTPVIFLESFSTQNDLVAAFFVLVAIYGILELKNQLNFIGAFWIGCGMGFSLFTKNTSYFFLLPWVLYIIWLFYKKISIKFFYIGLIIAALTIIINLPFYARNLHHFQTLIPREGTLSRLTNERLDASSFGGNMIKTIAFNLTTTHIKINNCLENTVYGYHRIVKIDPSDPKLNFIAFEMPYGVKFYSHDYVPNPLQAWCLLLLLPWLYIFRKRFNKDFYLTFIFLNLSFLLLILLLKWQPFGTRFQATFWAMVSVWIVITISRLLVSNVRSSWFVTILIILSTSFLNIHYLYYTINTSLFRKENIFNTQREKLYFAPRPHLYQLYKNAIKQIKESKCNKVALKLENNDWEYGIWVLLRNEGLNPIIKHQNIDRYNVTRGLEDKNFIPCIKLTLDDAKNIALVEK